MWATVYCDTVQMREGIQIHRQEQIHKYTDIKRYTYRSTHINKHLQIQLKIFKPDTNTNTVT